MAIFEKKNEYKFKIKIFQKCHTCVKCFLAFENEFEIAKYCSYPKKTGSIRYFRNFSRNLHNLLLSKRLLQSVKQLIEKPVIWLWGIQFLLLDSCIFILICLAWIACKMHYTWNEATRLNNSRWVAIYLLLYFIRSLKFESIKSWDFKYLKEFLKQISLKCWRQLL